MRRLPRAPRALAALLGAVSLTLTGAATGCRRGAVPLAEAGPPSVPRTASDGAARSPAASTAASDSAANRPFHRLPKLDVHMHIGPDSVERTVALMDRWGITGVVNLSGMYPGPPVTCWRPS